MFGAIIGATAALGSTLMKNHSAKKQAQMARDEADKNRMWQENMSNTSIQRRMADLKAAGLNPLLAVESASSGASTPSGSTSGAQADISAIDVTTAINAYLAKKQGQAIDAGIEKTEAETENIRSNTLGVDLDNKIKEYQKEHNKLLVDLEKHNINAKKLENEILNSRSEQEKIRVLEENRVLEKLNIEVKNEEEKQKQLIALTKIMEAEAGSWTNTPFGRKVKDVFDLFNTGINSGAALYNITHGGK